MNDDEFIIVTIDKILFDNSKIVSIVEKNLLNSFSIFINYNNLPLKEGQKVKLNLTKREIVSIISSS